MRATLVVARRAFHADVASVFGRCKISTLDRFLAAKRLDPKQNQAG